MCKSYPNKQISNDKQADMSTGVNRLYYLDLVKKIL